MPTTYAEAPTEVYRLMGEVLDEHFSNLKAIDPELSITILMATNHRGAALKRAGCPAAAMIKIVGAEERSNGGPDLRILIDERKWQDLSDRSKAALLHHELTHIVPQWVKGSEHLKLDPYGRPAVKLKPDDWMITGFRATVEAFGEDALEHRSITVVHEQLRQLVLLFVASSEATAPEASKPKRGGDLVTSRPGTWHDHPEEQPKPKRSRKALPHPLAQKSE